MDGRKLLIGALPLVPALLGLPALCIAHDAPSGFTYSLQCCLLDNDCRPVPSAWVTEGPDGYTVPTGEVIPYGSLRLKVSPDGRFHWCTRHATDDGKTICLYVPPRGA